MSKIVGPFYHGGAAGLKPGDLVLCAALLMRKGIIREWTLDHKYGNPTRGYRVYVTTDLDYAEFFAGGTSRHAGSVYMVDPYGDFEPDPEVERYAYRCIHARVLEVVIPTVTPEMSIAAVARRYHREVAAAKALHGDAEAMSRAGLRTPEMPRSVALAVEKITRRQS